jgi:hypothetical protein
MFIPEARSNSTVKILTATIAIIITGKIPILYFILIQTNIIIGKCENYS